MATPFRCPISRILGRSLRQAVAFRAPRGTERVRHGRPQVLAVRDAVTAQPLGVVRGEVPGRFAVAEEADHQRGLLPQQRLEVDERARRSHGLSQEPRTPAIEVREVREVDGDAELRRDVHAVERGERLPVVGEDGVGRRLLERLADASRGRRAWGRAAARAGRATGGGARAATCSVPSRSAPAFDCTRDHGRAELLEPLDSLLERRAAWGRCTRSRRAGRRRRRVAGRADSRRSSTSSASRRRPSGSARRLRRRARPSRDGVGAARAGELLADRVERAGQLPVGIVGAEPARGR